MSCWVLVLFLVVSQGLGAHSFRCLNRITSHEDLTRLEETKRLQFQAIHTFATMGIKGLRVGLCPLTCWGLPTLGHVAFARTTYLVTSSHVPPLVPAGILILGFGSSVILLPWTFSSSKHSVRSSCNLQDILRVKRPVHFFNTWRC